MNSMHSFAKAAGIVCETGHIARRIPVNLRRHSPVGGRFWYDGDCGSAFTSNDIVGKGEIGLCRIRRA